MLTRLYAALCAAMILFTCALASSQTQYQVIYNFGSNGASDGLLPSGKLLPDALGNFYGTTLGGGTNGYGTVFELSPSATGWTESVLYSFCNNGYPCPDGEYPASGLIFDELGNLYGTTQLGGANGQVCCWGTVFELSPPAMQGGAWTESILYTFGGNTTNDGCYPEDKLTFDAAGNLYGTASQCNGPPYAAGSVFELTPSGGGTWNETVLYRFCANGHGSCPNGATPKAEVVFDQAGNLYGTAEYGGRGGGLGGGAAFELSPAQSGGWTEAVLRAFLPAGGVSPLSSINIDPAGNLYGTTSSGGEFSQLCRATYCGGVFRLSKVNGQWKATTIQFNGTNGGIPVAGLFLDSKNSAAYGTTQYGGTQGSGVVFKVQGDTESVLYNFCSQSNCADGYEPVAALASDTSGHLYGTTSRGGAYGNGVVFEITP